MKRLAAADAWFLYLENPNVHLHVTGVVIADPTTAPEGLTRATVRRHVLERIDALPTFRQRLVEVPFGVDHPVWIEDPDFDVDHHIRRHRLRSPGTLAELAAYVGWVAAIQLDRTRPLWEIHLIDGLSDGRVAFVVKMHHATVDGVSGIGIMSHLLDLDAAPLARSPAEAPATEEVPSAARMLVDAAVNRILTPGRVLRSAGRAAGSLVSVGMQFARQARPEYDGEIAHPLGAPRTPFSGTLSPRRTIALGVVPLDDLKVVRTAFGVTVNDVLLAICTSGLRSYLQDRDALPDRPLICSVPVSVHGEADPSTNQVSSIFVNLPVQIDDPAERLSAIHSGSSAAKRLQAAIGPNIIGDVVELIPTPLFELSARLYSAARLADRLPPVHNLVISNIIGSPVPLYLAGARITDMFPIGPLMEGTGLNISVLSHEGCLDIGIIACPDLVDDVDAVLAATVAGLAELVSLAAKQAVGGRSTRRRPARTPQPKESTP